MATAVRSTREEELRQVSVAPMPSPDQTTEDLELTVVMPCLNEERTVVKCVEKALGTMKALDIRGEVLVVDNGSIDRSVELTRAAGGRVVHQSLKGYGNALRKGFAEARGRYILMGDCDESYDFGDLGRFVAQLRGGADLVMGNRLAGEVKPGAMPWLHRWIGNPGLTWFLNLLFRARIGDTYCGLRGFRSDAVPRMNLQMPGMELAPEMVIKSARAGLRIEEIPITLWPDGRDRKPHLRTFRDGWRGLRFMLMCSPTFLFILPGLLLVLLGLAAIPVVVLAGYGVFTNIFGPNFMYTASLVSITGAQVAFFGLLAKLYAHQVDPVFRDARLDRLTSFFNVERGLFYGAYLIAGALILGLPVFIHWCRTLEVPVPGQWVFAGTLFVLGVQTCFAAFLIGILDLKRENGRTG